MTTCGSAGILWARKTKREPVMYTPDRIWSCSHYSKQLKNIKIIILKTVSQESEMLTKKHMPNDKEEFIRVTPY